VRDAREFRVRTARPIERLDITKQVEKAAGELGLGEGVLLVSTPHTTAAVTVGEAWDPDVTGDIERALAAWVPDVRFDHGEGNSPAHFLSETIGNARLLPVEKGKPLLGRWQGVFLIELDGPRERTVRVAAL
jgi:secondary thiamine-phosphate synthase enzyme